jgi:outer membrane lipoprotein-sorting protein
MNSQSKLVELIRRASFLASGASRLSFLSPGIALALATLFTIPAAIVHAAELPSVDQIVARMREADEARSAALEAYTVTRRYELVNHRFKATGTIVARMNYKRPGEKEFVILSETGSRVIRDRVLKRAIATEEDASHGANRNLARIDLINYDLKLAGITEENGHSLLILDLSPKSKSPYLLHGRAWIDQQDYALARVEGTLAKKPSPFIGAPVVRQVYQKRGLFWVPDRNVSVTDAPIFGKTDLVIESTEYEIRPLTDSTQISASLP